MGYFYDTPPPGTPDWVMPIFAGLSCLGVGCWLVAYVLMARRSLATNATAVPLLVLGLNLAWEVVFAFYVADGPLDRIGFGLWFIIDIPLVWSTLRTIPKSFAGQPFVRKWARTILFASFLTGTCAFGYYARWWLASPGTGSGDKTGKRWNGIEGRDSSELCFWTAAPLQLLGSLGSVSMLMQRGHSGGTSYTIWAFRAIGSLLGLPVACVFLWWYWPEANGFVTDPFAIIMLLAIAACDILCPFVIAAVRKTEVVLADGSVVARWSPEAQAKRLT
ncbi:PaxB protein [Sarocladium implicatum]|nr:PaxB protein [Sarocladium implicatum]